MAIKHLSGRTFKEIFGNADDLPIWKRKEAWASPLAIILVIGYAAYGILFGVWWIIKWILFSWMRPFSNSRFLCKIGFHAYRKVAEDYETTTYLCKICNKTHVYYDGD